MVAQTERRFIKERQRDPIERVMDDGIYAGGKLRFDRDRIRSLQAASSGPAATAKGLACSRMRTVARSGALALQRSIPPRCSIRGIEPNRILSLKGHNVARMRQSRSS